MNGRVPSNLSSGHIVVSGMGSKTKDIIGMGRVVTLFVALLAVDNAQGCYVIDYFFTFGIV